MGTTGTILNRQEVDPEVVTNGQEGIWVYSSVTNKTQRYAVFYYHDQKTAQVLPVDDNGDVLIDAKPIYTNGVWDKSLFEADNPNAPFDEEQQLFIHGRIQQSVRTHVENTFTISPSGFRLLKTGGQVPQWASREMQGKDVSDVQNVGTLPMYEGAGTGDGTKWQRHAGNASHERVVMVDNDKWFIEEAFTKGPLHVINKSGIQGGGYDKIGDRMFNKIMTYPADLDSAQDYFFIQAYAYMPPYNASLTKDFGTKADDTSIGYGLQRQSPFRKKLGAGIKLPMPNGMSDRNSADWVEDSMTTMSLGALQNINKNATNKVLTQTLNLGQFIGLGNLGDNINSFFTNAALTTALGGTKAGRTDIGANLMSQLAGANGFDVTSESILSRSGGIVANSNTELMFSGVKMRTFQFSWRMSPRSADEAGRIRMIIRAMKQWSAPKKLAKVSSGPGSTALGSAGSTSYFLGTPNVFRLRYMSGGKGILGVNKFKPCAMTSISINYTPDQMWQAYEGGQPVSVIMDCEFAELEPIFDTDYVGSVQGGREFNEDDPESLGDLYPISIINENDPSTADVGY